MTGFAEKKFDHKSFSIKISIRGVNHRYLDWNCRGANIGGLEDRLRVVCQRRIQRGRLDVFIDIQLMDQSKWDVWINDDLLSLVLSSLKKSFAKIKREFKISIDNVFNIPHIIELKRKEFSREEELFIADCFKEILDEFIKAREREGREIKKELKIHAQNIKAGVQQVGKMAKKQPRLIKEKLKERFKDLETETYVNEEKLLVEASFLAQRYDLTEEVERLMSHLAYIQEILSPKTEGPVGKKLDFIAQELYRETNTINSKAQDIRIIKGCLALKNEVESIRQQVQNLE
jgi:uncharacterized protein (TIGR00255 family)